MTTTNGISFKGKTTQKAAVCHGALDLRVVSEGNRRALARDGEAAHTQEDRPVREPGEGEVQVAMGVTGLCGSDRESSLNGV